MKLTQKILGKISSKINSLSQSQGGGYDDKSVTEGMPELLRKAAAEGAVLLKNDGVLPFGADDTVSLFGRIQNDSFFVGYGSGGDVNAPYKVSYAQGIINCNKLKVNEELADIYRQWCTRNPVFDSVWGMWPRFLPEMPLKDNVVKRAAEISDAAVVFIGRSSGEDRENALKKGSYYLTDDELKMLEKVTSSFQRVTVVLNIGSIIDFSWLHKFGKKIGAVLIVWQGGMESGNALADLLCGDVSPSGKLTDTIAFSYGDYPSSKTFGKVKFNNYEEDVFVGYRYFTTFATEKIMFPFGFGLSYADFSTECVSVDMPDGDIVLKLRVTNVSDRYSGKEVVQVYYSADCKALIKPWRQLVGFAKTKLLAPGEGQEVEITVPQKLLASYDDTGSTGFKNAWVREQGLYKLYVGTDCVSARNVSSFGSVTTLVEQLTAVSTPPVPFERIAAVWDGKPLRLFTPEPEAELKDIILSSLPEGNPLTGDMGIKLSDVRNGKATIDEFVSQLNPDELEAISRGDYVMNSPLGAAGNAGVFGGVLASMREKGITPVVTTDGPSGIRLKAGCSLLPIGTLLACSWNTELVEEVYSAVGQEMKDKGSDVLLAPGMNIHRNPLCGRNFEYYSEDPLLTGKIAAAVVRGIQCSGLSACPKHFACNNQETNRCYNDSRVSERALREIYLKGFEICVKEAAPKCLMTSYNKINGVWGHYNYELCTTVLRNEWGFEGCVMTDWWMRKSSSPEFPQLCDNAYRVRAQVDVLMPGGDRVNKGKPDGTLLKTFGSPDGITSGELQRTAKNVVNLILNLPEKDVDSD